MSKPKEPEDKTTTTAKEANDAASRNASEAAAKDTAGKGAGEGQGDGKEAAGKTGGAKEGRREAAKDLKPGGEFVTAKGHDQLVQQHELVDKTREERDEANREGHEKNLQAQDEEAEQIEKANENFVASGKEDNRNTPIVHADGSKSWT